MRKKREAEAIMIEKYKIQIRGTRPLLMHSCNSMLEAMQRNEIYLTNLEKKVKSFLDVRGIRYISQYPLRQGFIADFALPDKKIIIEVDGERWHSGKKKVKKDRFRDYMLKRDGWTTIRIKEKEINNLQELLCFFIYS